MAKESYSDTDPLYTIIRTKLLDNDLTELFADIAALGAGSGVLISSNDTTIGYLNAKMIAAASSILAKTADYTVTSSDLMPLTFTENDDGGDETLTLTVGTTIITNTGAAGAVNLSLPVGASGYQFLGIVTVAQYLRFTANGTETFRWKSTQGAAGGYTRSNVIGNMLHGYWAGSEWLLDPIGLWKLDE